MGRAWRIEFEGGLYKEIPHYRALGKNVAPEKVLKKSAGILNCELEGIMHSRRIPKSKKEDRDLLLYLVWKTMHADQRRNRAPTKKQGVCSA
jgi:hypothetical protein